METMDAERAALEKTDQEWLAAVRAGDVERAVSFWADDAVVLAPGMPLIAGKAAIRAFVAESFRMPGFSISWVTETWVVSRDGSMAYGIGTNLTTYQDAGGNVVTIPGKSATVWRKGADGWKCVVDVWNEAPQGVR